MANCITKINSRADFLRLLENNPGMIILKLGATWCRPCHTIHEDVHKFFATLPQDGSVIYGDIDVDQSSDLYALLKSQRRVNGIPVMLCYMKGLTDGIAPTISVTGADKKELYKFFDRCTYFLQSK